MKLYAIANWDRHYENNRTRELKRLDFVLVPNKQDGDGYRTLMASPRGLEMFAVWILLLELASKCSPRGVLVRDNGQPHTAATLSRMLCLPEEIVQLSLDQLASDEIGWMQITEEDGSTPAFSATVKKRAHGMVNRSLNGERPLFTPGGRLSVRPTVCQWCNTEAPKDGKGNTGILAHHPVGYGDPISDITVIFVCRKCHASFETGAFTTSDIMQRFGITWLGSKVADKPQDIAERCDYVAPTPSTIRAINPQPSAFDTLRQRLNTIYGPARRWSNYEEQMLAEIARQPTAWQELNTILRYRESLPPADRAKYFPQSVQKLLENWGQLIDRAAVVPVARTAVDKDFEKLARSVKNL